MKVFACDMDGTLLNSEGQVSTANYRAINRLAAAGYHVILVSGRHPMLMLETYHALGLQGPLIGCNGSFIFEPSGSNVLPSSSVFTGLEAALVEQILEVAASQQVDVFLDTNRGMVKLRDHFQVLRHYPAAHEPFEMLDYTGEPYCLPGGLQVCKVVLSNRGGPANAGSGRDNSSHLVLQDLQEKIVKLGRLEAVFSAYLMLDIFTGDTNKWTGLEQTLQGFKYLVAIGDGENDIPLLKAADCGIAMGNAAPQVQTAANFVCGHHDEDGLAQAVEWLLTEGYSIDFSC